MLEVVSFKGNQLPGGANGGGGEYKRTGQQTPMGHGVGGAHLPSHSTYSFFHLLSSPWVQTC